MILFKNIESFGNLAKYEKFSADTPGDGTADTPGSTKQKQFCDEAYNYCDDYEYDNYNKCITDQPGKKEECEICSKYDEFFDEDCYSKCDDDDDCYDDCEDNDEDCHNDCDDDCHTKCDNTQLNNCYLNKKDDKKEEDKKEVAKICQIDIKSSCDEYAKKEYGCAHLLSTKYQGNHQECKDEGFDYCKCPACPDRRIIRFVLTIYTYLVRSVCRYEIYDSIRRDCKRINAKTVYTFVHVQHRIINSNHPVSC